MISKFYRRLDKKLRKIARFFHASPTAQDDLDAQHKIGSTKKSAAAPMEVEAEGKQVDSGHDSASASAPRDAPVARAALDSGAAAAASSSTPPVAPPPGTAESNDNDIIDVGIVPDPDPAAEAADELDTAAKEWPKRGAARRVRKPTWKVAAALEEEPAPAPPPLPPGRRGRGGARARGAQAARGQRGRSGRGARVVSSARELKDESSSSSSDDDSSSSSDDDDARPCDAALLPERQNIELGDALHLDLGSFCKEVQYKTIHQRNETRWSGFLLMLESILQKCSAVNIILQQYEKEKLVIDASQRQEMRLLKAPMRLAWLASKHLQGWRNYTPASTAWYVLHGLLAELQAAEELARGSVSTTDGQAPKEAERFANAMAAFAAKLKSVMTKADTDQWLITAAYLNPAVRQCEFVQVERDRVRAKLVNLMAALEDARRTQAEQSAPVAPSASPASGVQAQGNTHARNEKLGAQALGGKLARRPMPAAATAATMSLRQKCENELDAYEAAPEETDIMAAPAFHARRRQSHPLLFPAVHKVSRVFVCSYAIRCSRRLESVFRWSACSRFSTRI